MRAGTVLAGLALAPVIAGSAMGQPKQQVLSGVTVSPSAKCLEARRPADPTIPHPKLVSSFPETGAVIRPGIVVLRVTFDLPMSCEGIFQPSPPLEKPCPGLKQEFVLSFDRRTIRMACLLDKNVHYGVQLNPVRSFLGKLVSAQQHPDFTNLAGWPSDPYELTFTTSAEAPVASLAEALAEDIHAPPPTSLPPR